jgi:hypothetical protein
MNESIYECMIYLLIACSRPPPPLEGRIFAQLADKAFIRLYEAWRAIISLSGQPFDHILNHPSYFVFNPYPANVENMVSF